MRRALAALAALTAFVAATPARAANDPLVYVALGDSYTSGPIVLPHDQRWVPQDCAQSLRNYPHLVAMDLKPDVFKDVSCASATIDDFTQPQHAAVNGVAAPQFDALNPSVDVVTVGIGGNDVGFVGFALDCMRFQPPPLGEPPCTQEYRHDGVDEISNKIAATAPELGRAIDEIHRLAPHAVVLIVSYPDALPDDGVGCYPYLPILNEDMPYVVAKFKEMNAMLATVASGHGASYVDIYTSSIGHDACKPPALAWVNGAVLVPPSFPAHPNDLSFVHSAPVVAQAIRVALAKQSSAVTVTTSTTAPAPGVHAAPALLPRTGYAGDNGVTIAGSALALVLARRRGSRRRRSKGRSTP